MSERLACGLLGMHRSTQRRVLQCRRDVALRMRIKEIAASRPRYGYRRIHVLLLHEGWEVNHKLLFRIYKEEDLQVQVRRRKKRTPHLRVAPTPSSKVNERWAMDFVTYENVGGRRIRALTLIDTCSRECHAIHVAPSITGADVARILSRVIRRKGRPETVTCDNGPEFRGRVLDAWANSNSVKLDFIRPGRPVEKGHIESFSGKLRDECLSAHWFLSLDEARRTIEDWRNDYNYERPHSALNYLCPAAYAAGQRV